MKGAAFLVVIACLGTIGCSEDPARSVKIAARPQHPAAASAAPVSTTHIAKVSKPPRIPDPGWHPDFCPPPAEGSEGPSTLSASGPCEFEHRSAVSCESIGDDFIVALTRKARNGATLVVYLNVEQYHGPGTYDGGQMFIAVEGGSTIYRWSSDAVKTTVGAGEAFAELPSTRLEGEAMLLGCTSMIGPSTNYQYQCDPARDAPLAIDKTVEIVSGKLQCRQVKKR